MHGVNLDLLQTTPYHADGTPRDRHAFHRAEHRKALRETRQARRVAALARLLTWFHARKCRPSAARVPDRC
ncbi:hypothetical protein [Tabrizicola caldifontis]|uniref:hypothetical protein n=1 Tax=Tabrizicola caldifontis TaxID=2528036 RepID=UPI0010805E21|nr:hypothetical protein [Rhodobacter sp. YIM 73028]